MTSPNPYARQQNFTNWQSNNPGVIYNGTDFDNEFNAIATALNATIANLKLIQRADGAIASQSVGRDQLAASVVQGINAPAAWVTGHAYSQRDSVIINNIWYWCNIAHTSGTFATDLAVGDWILINDFSLALSNPFSATSTTNNVAIGTGAKTLAIQSGKSFVAGQWVEAIDSGNAANSITGTVTSYTGTSLVLNIPASGAAGSGTPAGWNVVISGPQGATGSSGSGSGNVINTGASVANQIPKYTDTTGTAIAPGYTVGTGNNNLVQLNGSAQLPAVDGSQLTNIPGFTTGDVKFTLKTVADATWVMMNDGTIGDASSGGTTRANADTSALFTLLWNNTANAQCQVSDGRGANAAADFAAHKTITLPLALGRALAGAGSGSGLTSRALASIAGEETHLLATSELPAHSHTISDPGHQHNLENVDPTTSSSTSGGVAAALDQGSTSPTKIATTGITGTANAGGGGAHNNIQPTSYLNLMIKL